MDVKDIAALLDEYPEVKAHLKKMLDIIEGPRQGKFSRADDIEEQTIEAVRGLGRLLNWVVSFCLTTSRGLMLDSFYKSTALEWHFWNDSYNQVVFDAFV